MPSLAELQPPPTTIREFYDCVTNLSIPPSHVSREMTPQEIQIQERLIAAHGILILMPKRRFTSEEIATHTGDKYDAAS